MAAALIVLVAMPHVASQAQGDVDGLLANVDAALALAHDYGYEQPRDFFTPVIEAAGLAAPGTAPALVPVLNERLAGALTGDGTLAGKELVARELVLIANDAAVAALKPMLEDEETFAMALGVLARTPGPAADEALVQRLGQAPESQRLALILVLGDRRAVPAVSLLASYLADDDVTLAEAALRALSSIGTEEAYQALDALSPEAAKRLRSELQAATLLRAERMIASGKTEEGVVLCERLLSDGDGYMQEAALDMQLRAMEPPLVAETAMDILAQGAPKASQDIALKNLMELPEDALDEALLERLGRWPESIQLDILERLGLQYPRKVMPYLVDLADSGDAESVKRAEVLIAFLSPRKTIERIAMQAADSSDNVSRSKARGMLDGMTVADVAFLGVEADNMVNGALLGFARQVAPEAGAEIIASVQRRSGFIDGDLRQQFYNLAKASDTPLPLRLAVYEALKASKDETALPEFIDWLADPQFTAGRQELEQTIAASCSGGRLMRENEEYLIEAARQAPNPLVLGSFFRLMGQLGGPDSFSFLQAQILGSDQGGEEPGDLAMAAAREFARTSNANALSHLIEVAEQSKPLPIKVLALRGAVRLLAGEEMSQEQEIQWYDRALAAAPRLEEKRLVLSKIAEITVPQTLASLSRVVDEPSLQPVVEATVREIVFPQATVNATTAEASAPNAIDGDPATAWRAEPSSTKARLEVHLNFHYRLHYCVFLGEFPGPPEAWRLMVEGGGNWAEYHETDVKAIDGGLLFELIPPQGEASFAIEYGGEAPVAWSVAEVKFLYPGADKLGIGFPPFP